MTHIVYTSIAQRLDAGTYSPSVAANLRTAPIASTMPVASIAARVATVAAPYVGSMILGALLALAFQVQP